MKKVIAFLLAVVTCLACCTMTGCNKDEIVCYTNAFFAPFEYYDANQKIVGVDVEIMEKVGEKMGKTVKIVDADFAILIDTTSEGKLCDCAAAGITITEARKEKVAFSTPYYTSIQYVIFKKGSVTVSKNSANEDVIFWESLANKKIAVQMDTTGDIYTGLEINDSTDEANFDAEYTGALQGKGATRVKLDTAQLAYDSIKSFTNDVVIVDKLPAMYLVKNDTADYQALPLYYDAEIATEEQYAIAVNKEETELLKAINEVLAELMATKDEAGKDGVETLVMKHFGA